MQTRLTHIHKYIHLSLSLLPPLSIFLSVYARACMCTYVYTHICISHVCIITNITATLHHSERSGFNYAVVYCALNRAQCQSTIRSRIERFAFADGDTKNMSRVQLRACGLLEDDENSRKSSCAARDKYLRGRVHTRNPPSLYSFSLIRCIFFQPYNGPRCRYYW